MPKATGGGEVTERKLSDLTLSAFTGNSICQWEKTISTLAPNKPRHVSPTTRPGIRMTPPSTATATARA